MWKDEIVEEIRKIRDLHASQFNYNIDKIYQDLKQKEMRNMNKKVSLTPKPYLKPTGTMGNH